MRGAFSKWRGILLLVGVWLGVNVVVLLYVDDRGAPASRAPCLPAAELRKFEARHLTVPKSQASQQVLSDYRLLKPARIERGKKYPVVVFLHGSGERGDDNCRQLSLLPAQMASREWRNGYPCFLIAPQCPEGRSWHEFRPTGADADRGTLLRDPLDDVVSILEDVLHGFPADPERVYLTGFSMGGYGAWHLAARRPELFAAVVPVAGGGEPSQAVRMIGLPIWAVHGDADASVPVEESRMMIEAITKAGGHPRYSELPAAGHGIADEVYRDPKGVVPWMFTQRRKQASSTSNAVR